MKYKCLIILSLLYSLSSPAQENNIWYFGNHAGLDFSSGSPIALTNGQLYSNEATAAISDNAGNLLFYTNSVTVWNSNHSIMPNGSGLLGNISSSQGAVIVPKPGSTTKYYIFTTDELAGSNGMKYSEVDMSLQSGLGDVTSTKNISLHPVVSEKLIAIQRCDGNTWVISHEWGTNKFFANLVTSSGINPSIATNVGSIHTGGSLTNWNAVGYMKASQQGNRIALAMRDAGKFEVFDFDVNTGIISNPISISTSYGVLYGVEFSPDGTKLYGSSVLSGAVLQYDLTTGSTASIIASETLIGNSSDLTTALQLGPDNKIYVGKSVAYSVGKNYLDRIDSPNSLGAACNYSINAVYLGGKQCLSGLPNCLIKKIPTTPNYSIQGDTALCLGQDEILTVLGASATAHYQWSTTDTLQSIVVNTPGNYSVIITDTDNCYNIDTLYRIIGVNSIPVVNLGVDVSQCFGTSVILNAGNSGSVYLWSTTESSQIISVNSTGSYFVVVTDGNGCSNRDTIDVEMRPLPNVVLGPDIAQCGGNIILTAGNPGSNYLWSTGDTTQQIIVNTPGIYSVLVTDTNGCSNSDGINVDLSTLVNTSAGPDQTILLGSSAGISVIPAGNNTYLWFPPQGLDCYDCSNPNASPTVTTTYILSVIDSNGCTGRDTVTIFVEDIEELCKVFIPNAFSPNSDANNDVLYVRGNCIEKFNFSIFDRWGEKVFETSDQNFGWDGRYKEKELSAAVFVYQCDITLFNGKKISKKGNVSLIK